MLRIVKAVACLGAKSDVYGLVYYENMVRVNKRYRYYSLQELLEDVVNTPTAEWRSTYSRLGKLLKVYASASSKDKLVDKVKQEYPELLV